MPTEPLAAYSTSNVVQNRLQRIMHATDFRGVRYQGTIFFPDGEYSGGWIRRHGEERWRARFDGEAEYLPNLPPAAPPELVRATLKSADDCWLMEFAPVRVNFVWRRRGSDEGAPTLQQFFEEATEKLCEYAQIRTLRVGRLGAVVSRYAFAESPALEIAHHFAADRWHEQPLNRPENFELHAHKRYELPNHLAVNSWMRVKSGRISRPPPGRPAVLAEQDINTLAEEAERGDFSPDQIQSFLLATVGEFDTILGMYFP